MMRHVRGGGYSCKCAGRSTVDMAVACRYTLDRAKEVAEHVRPRHLADGYDFAFVDGASFRDRLVVFVRERSSPRPTARGSALAMRTRCRDGHGPADSLSHARRWAG